MLVLSRKTNQTILFPNLGINVEILRVAGNSVSIGIKAPPSIQILRGELAQGDPANGEPIKAPHALRNQLHKAHLAVALAQKQIQNGQTDNADKTLDAMLDMLRKFDEDLNALSGDSKLPATIPSSSPASSTRRALVVEDDVNERKLLAGYLRLCGMHVLEAADGIEALENLKSQSFDLVVLDIRMPRMDGADVLRSIRTMPKLRQTKVIVVSGEPAEHSDYADVQTAVTDWLPKPLDPAHLVKRLESVGP